MNTASQHEFHPGAESLNAFAEKALGERERADVLAHLAVCSRCRQVVTLAREAADAEVAAEIAAPPAQHAWWRSLWMAAVPAAALAATAALTVYVHVRNVERVSEVARVEPAAEAPNPSTSPAQPDEKIAHPAPGESAQPPAQAGNPPPAAVPRAHEHETPARERAPRELREHVEAEPVPELPDAEEQAKVNASSTAESSPRPPLRSMHGSEMGYVELAPRPAPLPPRASETTPDGGATAEYKLEPPSGMQEAQRQAEQRRQAMETNRTLKEKRLGAPAGAEAAEANAAEPAPAPPQPARPVPHPGLAGIAAFESPVARAIHLPGGVPASSIASWGHRELAIDDAGTLFLSEDAGRTWERVTPQWTGRAVVVRSHTDSMGAAESAPAAQAATPGDSAVESNGAPAPAEFFELLNDKNQVWLSTNGRIWIAE